MNKRIQAIVLDYIVRQGQRQEYQVDIEENDERESNRTPNEVLLKQEFSFACEFLDSLECFSHVDVDSERG